MTVTQMFRHRVALHTYAGILGTNEKAADLLLKSGLMLNPDEAGEVI